jgi:DNA-binding beta-propeller fold protein YncE
MNGAAARTRTPRAAWATATLALIAFALACPGSAGAADGAWARAWGKDVVNGGGTGFEICTAAASCEEGAVGALGGEIGFPVGVAVDSAGSVYVADQGDNRIEKYDSQGNFLRTWGKDVDTNGGIGFEICTVAASCKAGAGGGLGGEFDGVAAIATDAAGSVYVGDYGNRRIQKFDSQGNFLRAWGEDVDQAGGTGYEICIVASSCKRGSMGTLGGEFDGFGGIGTDSSGSVYVTDPGNQRVQKFDAGGSFQRAWGKDVDQAGGTGFEICTVAASCKAGVSYGGLGGELTYPRGIDADATGSVYVNDGYRVQKFDSLGNFQRAWGKDVDQAGGTGFEICTVAASCKTAANGALGGELAVGVGVAVDSLGSVYVSDANNQRVQKFDSQGNFLRSWG